VRVIFIPTAEAVIAVNKYICQQGGNPHNCNDVGKVESAISTAFYPGTYPFAHGGLVRVAGALCFYLVKSHAFTDGNKRTGALAAITFLNQHGMDLKYPLDEEKDINGLAQIIENCAAGSVSRDVLMDWFENHKIYLED
jgi:death-on-curing protein